MKNIFAITLVLIASVNSIYCQNKTINGRLIAEDLETIPFALIRINDTVEVGKTDLNGFFQIEIPVSINKLTLMFVGLEPTKIELADTCNEVEVIMMFSVNYDFKTFKKVDKLRMKRFKKLTGLHKEAFEKGLFKTDKACFTQEFIPIVKKN